MNVQTKQHLQLTSHNTGCPNVLYFIVKAITWKWSYLSFVSLSSTSHHCQNNHHSKTLEVLISEVIGCCGGDEKPYDQNRQKSSAKKILFKNNSRETRHAIKQHLK